jgi:hypothetical protein
MQTEIHQLTQMVHSLCTHLIPSVEEPKIDVEEPEIDVEEPEIDVEEPEIDEEVSDDHATEEYSTMWWKHKFIKQDRSILTNRAGAIKFKEENLTAVQVRSVSLKINQFANQKLSMPIFHSKSAIDEAITKIWERLEVDSYDNQLSELHHIRIQYLRFCTEREFIGIIFNQIPYHQEFLPMPLVESNDLVQRSLKFYNVSIDSTRNSRLKDYYLNGLSVFECQLLNEPIPYAPLINNSLQNLLEFRQTHPIKYVPFKLRSVVKECTTPFLGTMDFITWLKHHFRNPYHRPSLVYLPCSENIPGDEHTFFILTDYDVTIDNTRYWDKMSRCIEFAEELRHSVAQYCVDELYTLYTTTIGVRKDGQKRVQFNFNSFLKNHMMATKGVHLIRNLLQVIDRYTWIHAVQDVIKECCEWYPDYSNTSREEGKDELNPNELLDEEYFLGDPEKEGMERLRTMEQPVNELQTYLARRFTFHVNTTNQLVETFTPQSSDTTASVRAKLTSMADYISDQYKLRGPKFIMHDGTVDDEISDMYSRITGFVLK